jgi:hypothetical protein
MNISSIPIPNTRNGTAPNQKKKIHLESGLRSSFQETFLNKLPIKLQAG